MAEPPPPPVTGSTHATWVPSGEIATCRMFLTKFASCADATVTAAKKIMHPRAMDPGAILVQHDLPRLFVFMGVGVSLTEKAAAILHRFSLFPHPAPLS